jgi:hypothetical protein
MRFVTNVHGQTTSEPAMRGGRRVELVTTVVTSVVRAGDGVDLESRPMAPGVVGTLERLYVAAHPPVRITCRTVVDGVATARLIVLRGLADPSTWPVTLPRGYVRVTGVHSRDPRAALFTGFQVCLLNLSPTETETVSASFFYVEEAP